MKEAKVLLYYLYREIVNVEEEKDWQLRTCEELEILGRIRIAREGINGTVGGAVDRILEYEKRMTEKELFRGIDFKSSMAESVPFSNLSVQIRPEIVTLGVDRSKIDLSGTGLHLTPEEFHEEILHADDRTVVIDIRNEYESKIGKFEGAVGAPLRQFSDLPRVATTLVDKLHLKDKKVLVYCTGGVRCELGSALLRSYGVDEVLQLSGGIHNYLETFRNGGLFLGKNFVFDERVAVGPPDKEPQYQQALEDAIAVKSLLMTTLQVVDADPVAFWSYSNKLSFGGAMIKVRLVQRVFLTLSSLCLACLQVLVCDNCAEASGEFQCANCPALVSKPRKTRRKRKEKWSAASVDAPEHSAEQVASF
eukprot:CAMPEP_0184746652 /NCGR_PEP_ID=MMETSP0315-20130426/9169_1 /TAXON_ID=101924 /ORGANISM="Rhodosorus marinus, Strain UTEX LB 2760" /LENGTH=363 /DNA_ID=CAMNT_0027219327 /DNA_START=188 /DNA_END=1280 /DNA_ORIENTATION=+